MARPCCTPTTHTNALTDAPRSPGSMPSGYKMGARKKVGWREGLELTGSGIRRAGDASGTAKVRKSQTPSPSPSPGSPACSLGRLPSSGAREAGRRAGAQLPLGCPPRPGPGPGTRPPSSPGLGRLPGKERLAKGLWGSKRAGQEHFARSSPAAHFFLCRHTPREPPSPTLHAHARVRPSHHPRSID